MTRVVMTNGKLGCTCWLNARLANVRMLFTVTVQRGGSPAIESQPSPHVGASPDGTSTTDESAGMRRGTPTCRR